MGKNHMRCFLEFLAITSVIYIADVNTAQLAAEKLNTDLDDLRVSSHQFQDPAINYHGIDSRNDQHPQRAFVEQLTNHIGKPLVALPPKSGTAQQTPTKPIAQSRKIKYNTAGQSRLTDPSAHLLGQRRSPPSGACQWMSLQEFKNVSLATGELIIRNSEGEPSYILTLRGSIRRDDNSYFPLGNFQVHPEASKVVISGSSNAAGYNLPLNCTVNSKSATGGSLFLPIQRPGPSFEEEITLLVDCGYLVLHLQSNGFYLALKSISFYRNLDAVSKSQLPGKRNRSSARAIPPMQSEQLVFTNEGTQTYPLLVLPLTSRYICQDRIVLIGKNSVRLELNIFELQRLTFPTFGEFETHSTDDIVNNQGGMIASTGRQINVRMKRDRDGKVWKNQASSVARCPNPTGPLNALTFMMDSSAIRRNYDTLSGVLPDKLTLQRSSASYWADHAPGRYLAITYLLTLHLLVYLFVASRRL